MNMLDEYKQRMTGYRVNQTFNRLRRLGLKNETYQLRTKTASPLEFKQAREILGASHREFAMLLGVKVEVVVLYEAGDGEPHLFHSKIVEIINGHPERFRGMLSSGIAKSEVFS